MTKLLTTRQKTVLILAAVLLAAGLFWLHYRATRVAVEQGNDRFGLDFISPPDHLADEVRYRGALDAGARWDRWPLYWH